MTHRGPFQPLPFCDSIFPDQTKAEIDWKSCFPEQFSFENSKHLGIFCAHVTLSHTSSQGLDSIL